jgi:hypothetical protein
LTDSPTPIVVAAIIYFLLLWPLVRLLSSLETGQWREDDRDIARRIACHPSLARYAHSHTCISFSQAY